MTTLSALVKIKRPFFTVITTMVILVIFLASCRKKEELTPIGKRVHLKAFKSSEELKKSLGKFLVDYKEESRAFSFEVNKYNTLDRNQVYSVTWFKVIPAPRILQKNIWIFVVFP